MPEQPPNLCVIGHIRSPFAEKFGIPRQPGLVPVTSWLEPEPAFAAEPFWRGIEGFSHLWLLWLPHLNEPTETPSATVRPPRLGGNERVGVFASRALFRPSPIGLSCVKLTEVETREGRVRLRLSGADLADGTPVVDVKPYLAYSDAYPAASGGFAALAPETHLAVAFCETLPLETLTRETRRQIEALLALNPVPAYQHNPARRYAMTFDGWHIAFRVSDSGILVTELRQLNENGIQQSQQ